MTDTMATAAEVSTGLYIGGEERQTIDALDVADPASPGGSSGARHPRPRRTSTTPSPRRRRPSRRGRRCRPQERAAQMAAAIEGIADDARRGRRDPLAGKRQDPLRGVDRRARLRDPVAARADRSPTRWTPERCCRVGPGIPVGDHRRLPAARRGDASSCRSTGRSPSSAPPCRTRCWPATPRSSSRRPRRRWRPPAWCSASPRSCPPGVLNVVTGKDENMAGLIQNTDVAKVCFTGSVNGGKRDHGDGLEEPHPGHPRARRQRRRGLPRGRRSSTTRTSTASTPRCSTHRADLHERQALCTCTVRAWTSWSRVCPRGWSKAGSATAWTRARRWGRCTRPRRRRSSQEIIEEAKDAGADVLEFGELPGGELTGGNFLRPAIVVDPDPSLRVVTQEQFGPVIPMIPFDTEDEAVAAGERHLGGPVRIGLDGRRRRRQPRRRQAAVRLRLGQRPRRDPPRPARSVRRHEAVGHGPRAGHRGRSGRSRTPARSPTSTPRPSRRKRTDHRRSRRDGHPTFVAPALLVAVLLIAANLRATITGVGPLLTQIADDLGTSEAALGALAAVPLIAFAVGVALRTRAERSIRDAARRALVARADGRRHRAWRSLPGSAVNLWLGTALIGASIAIANVLMPAVIKRDFSERITVVTAAFTALLAGMGAVASGVVVPISHVQTSTGDLGWQGALLWTGALLPFAIAAWLLSIRSRPRDAGSSARRRRSGIWRRSDRVAGAAVHGPAVEHLLHARHLVRPDRALARPLGGRGRRRRHDLPAVRDRGFPRRSHCC